MTSAAIYARISDDRAGQGLGVNRQEKDCRALCERNGWTVAEVIVDNDISAYSGKRRPGYERLLEGLKTGTYEAVVAWHPDRLYRRQRELENFIDAVEASGVEVATVMAGVIDLSTATGRMTARVVGAVAAHQSEQAAERIRRKHQELAEAGRPAGGGSRPFGYLPDRMTLDPVEAPLVAEAARQILDGIPLRSIVRDWTARGVSTVSGRPWTTHVLRRILTSARAGGFREHGGKRHVGQWEPLLDEVTWRRVRAVLLDPGRRVNHAPRAYLLTGGLAACGLCGRPLVARPRSDKRRTYVCASGPGFDGCGKIRALAETLEADVCASVALRLRDVPTVEPPSSAPLMAAMEETEAAMAELADDYYAHRAITREQFQSASAAIQKRLAELRREAARIERTPAIDADAAAVLAGDDMARKRAIVAAVVHQVVVGPARRGLNQYQPERVKITWRV